VSTGTVFMTTSAPNEGLTIDPVTGDFLANSFGEGTLTDIYQESQVAGTPEPDTLVLAALALAAIGARRLPPSGS
jgi:MYXO-CTERM domain-containing protein